MKGTMHNVASIMVAYAISIECYCMLTMTHAFTSPAAGVNCTTRGRPTTASLQPFSITMPITMTRSRFTLLYATTVKADKAEKRIPSSERKAAMEHLLAPTTDDLMSDGAVSQFRSGKFIDEMIDETRIEVTPEEIRR
jgi:hypothetical protein